MRFGIGEEELLVEGTGGEELLVEGTGGEELLVAGSGGEELLAEVLLSICGTKRFNSDLGSAEVEDISF